MYRIKKTMHFTICALAVFSFSSLAFAGTEEMKDLNVLQPKKVYSVPNLEAGEDLKNSRGFGDKEPQVKMMNLMMVEGSGFEEMDMNKMKLAETNPPAKETTSGGEQIKMIQSPAHPKTGANLYAFSVSDPSGKLEKGLKPKAQVYMLSMDMGTDTPPVKEVKPGVYQLKANFSMEGPWAIKFMCPSANQEFKVEVGNAK